MNFLQNLNINIFHLINSLAGQSAFWDKFWIFCTDWLGTIILIFVLILLIQNNIYDIANHNFKKILHKKDLILILLSSITTLVVVKFIKIIVYAPRPALVLTNIHSLVIENGYDSFPSLHTAFYITLALSVYYYNPKIGRVLLILASLIAISRVVVGAHYPSDVVVGLLLGIISVKIFRRVLRKF